MDKNIFYLSSSWIFFALFIGAACGEPSSETNDFKKSISTTIATGETRNHLYPSDSERQKDIQEEHFKDNFNFDIFKDIDWSDPSTYGPDCLGLCVGPASSPIGEHTIMPAIGITKHNYIAVGIKGDGSCWIRSVLHAILFRIFHDDRLFAQFLKKLDQASIDFKDIPGFSGRFRAPELKKLLTVLHKLSPQKRFQQLNKAHVDRFLINSFRAFLHASRAKLSGDNADDREKLRQLLTANSWGVIDIANSSIVDYFMPNIIFFGFDGLIDYYSNENDRFLYVSFGENDDLRTFLFKQDTFNNLEVLYRRNKKSLDERRSKYLSARQNYVKSLLPSQEDAMDTNKISDYYFDKLEKFQAVYLMQTLNISRFKDMHATSPMSIFAYPQTKGHSALLVHKKALKQFGL